MSNPSDRVGTRINLTLPPDVVAVIDRLCSLGHVGRATFIREFLTSLQGHMVGLADALELARGRNLDSFRVLADTLRDVSHSAGQLEMDLRKRRRAAVRKRRA